MLTYRAACKTIDEPVAAGDLVSGVLVGFFGLLGVLLALGPLISLLT